MADVRAALEQVRRERVAEGVTGDVLLDACLRGPLRDDPADDRGKEPAAAIPEEEPRALAASRQQRAPSLEVQLDRVRRGLRDWQVAVLAALAPDHAHQPLVDVHVLRRELRQ